MSTETALLHRAVAYALDAVDTVTPGLLSRPTPCAAWDLQTLLRHTSASVRALREGVSCGRVTLFPRHAGGATCSAAQALRVEVVGMLDEWSSAGDAGTVAIADHRIPLSMLAGAAALEIAVHGWDIAQASGDRRPIPPGLAADLLALSPGLVPDDNRHGLFAPPVTAAVTAGPDEKLRAFLGRPTSARVRPLEPARTEPLWP
jgi:uncharacterized protein (TIGR03086 family)